MKLLGIDFGLKNIGLATSEGFLAEPFKSLKVKDLEKTVKEIGLICQAEKIEKIVLGQTEGKLAPRIRGFKKKIEEKTSLPVFLQDETLSTVEAKEKMIEMGKGREKRKLKEHQVAASLILQDYLDLNSKKS
ncbi:Holliday junction resolvase RuvX [Candidatus Beckwithbacteria bacterium CG10_big_fil_rev_8_21_14_0_10_34_10]|uniref:Putative pre-16S rRNA nuclease n=1 Tax=Candidatus Beckwithbacteria bacterium CG10_big_fil_rev_8_21_14_0_10_34_10 TaxID=1974495 RepID=A0A2H0WA56_9BACT|nr:MAG: Holliday junction resolvase RuvX [Candidatus Beckwithbacteria bacterium CG10_big_fil_rev_8_21_14_0_10_34_10]